MSVMRISPNKNLEVVSTPRLTLDGVLRIEGKMLHPDAGKGAETQEGGWSVGAF